MKTIILVLFMGVLCCDFVMEFNRKKISIIDLGVRAFMLFASVFLMVA